MNIENFISDDKQFLKILLPIFLKEEDQANEYDLSYDEIILFQLKMIDYISKHQTTKIICLIELPYLSKEINDYLINMKNCFIVVMFYKTNSVLNIKDTYIFDDLIVDLNNDEQIYNIYLNKGCLLYTSEAFRYEGKEHLRTHHLYVCPQDSKELKRHLAFRNYLRKHPNTVKEYGKIKKEAAKLYPNDIEKYCMYKSQIIEKIYKEIGLK